MSGSNSSVRAGAADPSGTDRPLAFTVHSLPGGTLDDDARRRTAAGRLRMLIVLLVCAAPVVASYLTYFVVRPEGRTNYATLIVPQRPVPDDLPLADLDGRAVAPATLRGDWHLVVVGGGACDAACEKNLWLVRQLREAVGRDSARIAKVWLVDDDAALRPELRDALAQGAPTRVLRVPRAALAAWLQPEAGHALGEHLYVVDPMGMWMMRTPAAPDASRFKRDLERLLRASATWQPNALPRP